MTSTEVTAVREALGLTTKEFARALNIDHLTLCRWEREDASGSKPVGMHVDVLQGFQDILGEMPKFGKEIGKQLRGGLGAMLRTLCRKQFGDERE